MTTEEMVEDFKQFVATTVGQSEERVKTELRQEMKEGFEGVGGAIAEIHTVLDNHEARITKQETA